MSHQLTSILSLAAQTTPGPGASTEANDATTYTVMCAVNNPSAGMAVVHLETQWDDGNWYFVASYTINSGLPTINNYAGLWGRSGPT